MKIIIGIVITLIGVGIVYIISLIAASMEAKSFNNGVCKNCGTRLRLFDLDSHGGRGYCCDNCKNRLWVSYKSVDHDFLNENYF